MGFIADLFGKPDLPAAPTLAPIENRTLLTQDQADKEAQAAADRNRKRRSLDSYIIDPTVPTAAMASKTGLYIP